MTYHDVIGMLGMNNLELPVITMVTLAISLKSSRLGERWLVHLDREENQGAQFSITVYVQLSPHFSLSIDCAAVMDSHKLQMGKSASSKFLSQPTSELFKLKHILSHMVRCFPSSQTLNRFTVVHTKCSLD